MLRRIQNDLFDLGADLATPGEDFTPGEMTLRIVAAQVERLEAEIDGMNVELVPLRSLIMPGGYPADAAIHLARAIVCRAERTAVAAAVRKSVVSGESVPVRLHLAGCRFTKEHKRILSYKLLSLFIHV